MGNYISHRTCKIAGKLILSDGTIQEFDRPLAVAELMLEHPQHFVVELRSLEAHNQLSPLPADQKLDMKKAYVMLPMKRGKAGWSLSANEGRRIVAKARLVLRSGSLSGLSARWPILPLLTLMCPAGGVMKGQGVVSRRKVLEEEEEETKAPELLPECFSERPEYFSRQLSGKAWKPTLDPIVEKAVEKKVPHWLF